MINQHQPRNAFHPQKHVLNHLEKTFILLLRMIYNRDLTTSQQVEALLQEVPSFPAWYRHIAIELLVARGDGEELFWLAYDILASDYPDLLSWRPFLIGSPRTLKRPSAGTLLSDVTAQQIQWLWEPRIALGKLSILDGDPGLGKSMLMLDLAARLTGGLPMPDGSPGLLPPSGVVLIAPEDDLADTIQPRLLRAGADLSRIISLGSLPSINSTVDPYHRPFSLSHDLPLLEAAIDRVQARLVIIDPLMSLLGNKNVYQDNSVRTLLASLKQPELY